MDLITEILACSTLLSLESLLQKSDEYNNYIIQNFAVKKGKIQHVLNGRTDC